MSAPVVGGLGRAVRVPRTRLAVRVGPRSARVLLGLLVVVLVLLVLSVGTGELPIGPLAVVRALIGGGDGATAFVVRELRLPRAVCAILVGVALGAAGAIFQSVTRNPLGSPDVLGFVQGASVGAVLQIIVLGGGTLAIAGGSIVGGLATALLAYALAHRGGVQGYRLVLVGIGLAAMLVGITSYLLTLGSLAQAQGATVWLTGSLTNRGWEQVTPVALALVVLLPATALAAAPLRTLELGDEAAHALGLHVERTRAVLLLVGVALSAVGTAATGPIVFVALAAPQIARRLTRASGPNVGASAVTGAALLLGADVLSQRLFGDGRVPVGVVTGVAGGVYLIWLLRREWRSRG